MDRGRRRLVAGICLAAVLAMACGGKRLPVHTLTGSAFGTTFSITVVDPPPTLDTAGLASRVEAAIERIDRRMSTYRAESEISRFNAYAGIRWFPVSGEVCSLVAEALAHSAATDGAFDITVGPLVELWGFGSEAARNSPPEAALIETLLESTGFSALHTDCGRGALRKDIPALAIDLSAIAKGYAVDVLAGLVEQAGLVDFLVEVGGEMRVSGSNAEGRRWAVAVEAPRRDGRDVQRVIRITDTAVATSGDYRNYFEYAGRAYSHTLDPRTGYPVEHSAASVTVLADTAARADALATALLVMGPGPGEQFADREGLAALFLLREDGSIVERQTSAFAAEVMTE